MSVNCELIFIIIFLFRFLCYYLEDIDDTSHSFYIFLLHINVCVCVYAYVHMRVIRIEGVHVWMTAFIGTTVGICLLNTITYEEEEKKIINKMYSYFHILWFSFTLSKVENYDNTRCSQLKLIWTELFVFHFPFYIII